MRILIWLIFSSVHCSLDDNSETAPFRLLRAFFNDGNYNAEYDKRFYPWNPMKAFNYGDWLERLTKSPVYE